MGSKEAYSFGIIKGAQVKEVTMEPDWENGSVGDLIRWGVKAIKLIVFFLIIIAIFQGIELWNR